MTRKIVQTGSSLAVTLPKEVVDHLNLKKGDTVESAKKNLVEALELFLESADASEVTRRLHTDVFVTRAEVLVG